MSGALVTEFDKYGRAVADQQAMNAKDELNGHLGLLQWSTLACRKNIDKSSVTVASRVVLLLTFVPSPLLDVNVIPVLPDPE